MTDTSLPTPAELAARIFSANKQLLRERLEQMKLGERRALLRNILFRGTYKGKTADTAYDLARTFAALSYFKADDLNRDRVVGVIIGIPPEEIAGLPLLEKFAGMGARQILLDSLADNPALTRNPADDATALNNRARLLAKLNRS